MCECALTVANEDETNICMNDCQLRHEIQFKFNVKQLLLLLLNGSVAL